MRDLSKIIPVSFPADTRFRDPARRGIPPGPDLLPLENIKTYIKFNCFYFLFLRWRN